MTAPERVEHGFLSSVDEFLICAWLEAHGVNTRRTPVHAEIEYDPVFDEWRIEQWRMGPDNAPIVAPDGETLVSIVVRRRATGTALPWPTWGEKVDQLWDQVTAPEP